MMRSKNSLRIMIFVSLIVLSACVCQLPKTAEPVETDNGSELDCVDCTGMDHYREGDGIQVSLFTVHDESNPYRWHAQLTIHALEDQPMLRITLTTRSAASCSVVVSDKQVVLSGPRKYLNELCWELDLEQGQTENYEIELNECSLVQSGRIAELEVEAMTSNGHFVFDRNTIFVEGDNYQVLLYRTPYPTSANDPFMHNPDSYDENVTPMYPSPTPPATPADAIQTVYFLMTGTPYPTTPPRTATPVPPTPTPGVYP